MGTVVILILLGVLLLVAEIVVLPGIGVAGIAGGAAIIIGIILSYDISSTAGHLTVLATIVLCAIALYFALRSKTWKRLALNNNIDSSVDISPEQKNIKIGDEGIAVTRLAPMGKVRINGVELEARSLLDLIEHDTKIVVIKFEDSKVIVTKKEE